MRELYFCSASAITIILTALFCSPSISATELNAAKQSIKDDCRKKTNENNATVCLKDTSSKNPPLSAVEKNKKQLQIFDDFTQQKKTSKDLNKSIQELNNEPEKSKK